MADRGLCGMTGTEVLCGMTAVMCVMTRCCVADRGVVWHDRGVVWLTGVLCGMI